MHCLRILPVLWQFASIIVIVVVVVIMHAFATFFALFTSLSFYNKNLSFVYYNYRYGENKFKRQVCVCVFFSFSLLLLLLLHSCIYILWFSTVVCTASCILHLQRTNEGNKAQCKCAYKIVSPWQYCSSVIAEERDGTAERGRDREENTHCKIIYNHFLLTLIIIIINIFIYFRWVSLCVFYDYLKDRRTHTYTNACHAYMLFFIYVQLFSVENSGAQWMYKYICVWSLQWPIKTKDWSRLEHFARKHTYTELHASLVMQLSTLSIYSR